MRATNIQWDIDPDEYKFGIVLLPNEIDIPKNITDIEDISSYISDVTGFCHKGFCIED